MTTTLIGLLSLPLTAGATSVPSGYTDSYWVKSYTPSTSFVELTHSSSSTGDHFRAQFYPTSQVYSSDDCAATGAELWINGSEVTPSFRTDGEWVCHMEYYFGTGASLYTEEENVSISIIQGDVSLSTYGGPNSSYTGWYINTAGWAELQLSMGENIDIDGDGIWNTWDNCPYDSNYDQEDNDGDSYGDECDDDLDGDSISNSSDNCEHVSNTSQIDTDGDGMGDACDSSTICAYNDDGSGVFAGECSDSSSGYYTCYDEYCGMTSYGGDDYECTESDYDSSYCTDGCYWSNDHCECPSGECPECCSWTGSGCDCPWDDDGGDECAWWDYYGNCIGYGEWGTSENNGLKEQCMMHSSGSWECEDDNSSGAYCDDATDTGDDWGLPECSICYDDDGNRESVNCHDGGYSDDIGYVSHYVSGDGLLCGLSYDSNGIVDNVYCMDEMYCWADACDDTQRYYDEWTCYSYEMEEQRYTDWGYTNWCEMCYDSKGTEVENDCAAWDDGDDDDDDDHDPDYSWCEWYENYNGEWCETCYDDRGDQVSEECEADGGGNEYCSWESDDNADWCFRCYEDGRLISESDCYNEDDGGEPVMDEDEAEDQVRELERSLHYYENDLKEFSRFEKRLERTIEDYENVLEWIEEDAYWWGEEGWDTDALNDVEEEVEDAIDEMESLLGEVEAWYTEFEDVIEELEGEINGIDTSNFTWDDNDAYWLLLRKGDAYQVLREVYDGYIMYHEMNQGYFDWSAEKAKVLTRLEELDVDVPDDAEDDLEEAVEWFAEFAEAFADFKEAADEALEVIEDVPNFDIDDITGDDSWEEKEDIRDFFDYELWYARDDVQWAREDLHVFGWDHGLIWDVMDRLWQLESAYHSKDWIVDEIRMIREDVEDVDDGLAVLDTRITDSTVLQKIEDVYDVIDGVDALLDDLEDQAEDLDDPEQMDDLWGELDKIGMHVQPILEYIAGYVEDHWDSLGLSGEDEEIVERFLDTARDKHHGGGGCYERCDRLYDVYDHDVADMLQGMIGDDVVNDLVTQITASVMEAVMQHVDEIAFRVTEAILANFDMFEGEKFEEGFANDLLDNASLVQEEILALDFDEIDVESEVREGISSLEILHEDCQVLPMPDEEIATEMAEFWADATEVLSADPSVSEVTELVTLGEELYDTALDAKYENYLGLKDVPGPFDEDYEDTWYAGYVMEGQGDKWEGYKDAEGNPTWEYGPGNETLRAEALKMTLSTYGYDGTGGGDNWWSEWENKGEDLGLSIAYTDLTQPITREESFRLIYEVGTGSGLMDSDNTYDGEFPDVSASHDWQPVETLQDYGIVSGQGDTGNADFYSNLNRAEFAKVMMEVDGVVQMEEAGDELYSYLDSVEEDFSWKNFFASLGHMFREFLSASVFIK